MNSTVDSDHPAVDESKATRIINTTGDTAATGSADPPSRTGATGGSERPGGTVRPGRTDHTGRADHTDGTDGTLYAIGQAAAELEVSVRALRYYQEVGLLTPSGRTSGGNRLYSEADLTRVRRIRELQQLMGLNLDEIRVMLGHEDRLARVRLDYHASSDTAERARLLDAAEEAYTQLRDEINEKITHLESFRNEMTERLDRIARARSRLGE